MHVSGITAAVNISYNCGPFSHTLLFFECFYHTDKNNTKFSLYIKNTPLWFKNILNQDMWCSSGIAHERILSDLPSERPWCTSTLKRCVPTQDWCLAICRFYHLSTVCATSCKKKKSLHHSFNQRKLNRKHRCKMGSQAHVLFNC